MEHKTFSTPDGLIHYWVSSAGPKQPWLVLLPGLTADHRLFERQLEAFEGHFSLLVWDAPAHGLSRPFALRFSMHDLAAWLHGIIAAEGVEAPFFIGQSLGGYIAQAYISCWPEGVRGFVSIDSAPLSRQYYTNWELALLHHAEGMYRAIPWQPLLKWGITGTAATPYGRRLIKTIWADYERTEFCALAGHGYRMLAQAVEAQPAYALPCPVLLLCGKKDEAGSVKRYNRAWVKREGHRLVWIEGAGHNSNTDAPARVNALIEDFVRRH